MPLAGELASCAERPSKLRRNRTSTRSDVRGDVEQRLALQLSQRKLRAALPGDAVRCGAAECVVPVVSGGVGKLLLRVLIVPLVQRERRGTTQLCQIGERLDLVRGECSLVFCLRLGGGLTEKNCRRAAGQDK